MLIRWVLVKDSTDLTSIEIDDFLLTNLMEFPASALEIVIDPKTNRKKIQVKKAFEGMAITTFRTFLKTQNRLLKTDKFISHQKSSKRSKPSISSEIKMEETRK